MGYALVFDLETIPDLEAVSRLHGLPEHDEAKATELAGDKFQKHPLHAIACIGVLISEQVGDGWVVRSLGAPNIGERSEAELIGGFVDRIAELRPCLVSFNGNGFDLPVLRYRAMVNRISAPGLHMRPYYRRYSDDALDLCDLLSSFSPQAKIKLDELCKVLGLPGKPDGVDGSKVAEYVREGRIQEVSNYCETDVVNTYRVWLRHELFRGALTRAGFDASEAELSSFLRGRLADRPHLAPFVG